MKAFLSLAPGEPVDEAALDAGSAPGQMPSPRPRPPRGRHRHAAWGGLTVEATEHQAMDRVRQVEALAAGQRPQGALDAASAFRLR